MDSQPIRSSSFTRVELCFLTALILFTVAMVPLFRVWWWKSNIRSASILNTERARLALRDELRTLRRQFNDLPAHSQQLPAFLQRALPSSMQVVQTEGSVEVRSLQHQRAIVRLLFESERKWIGESDVHSLSTYSEVDPLQIVIGYFVETGWVLMAFAWIPLFLVTHLRQERAPWCSSTRLMLAISLAMYITAVVQAYRGGQGKLSLYKFDEHAPSGWAVWMMILTLASMGLEWLRTPQVQSNGPNYPRCRQCAYNLTGNESGICPECGTPIPADVMRSH